MPWKPGESGNPNGRPKVDYYLRNLARQHTEDAVQTLVNVMQDMGAQSSARVTAAVALLDRGWGKPVQEVSGPGGGSIVVQIATGIDRDPEGDTDRGRRALDNGPTPETPATS